MFAALIEFLIVKSDFYLFSFINNRAIFTSHRKFGNLGKHVDVKISSGNYRNFPPKPEKTTLLLWENIRYI